MPSHTSHLRHDDRRRLGIRIRAFRATVKKLLALLSSEQEHSPYRVGSGTIILHQHILLCSLCSSTSIFHVTLLLYLWYRLNFILLLLDQRRHVFSNTLQGLLSVAGIQTVVNHLPIIIKSGHGYSSKHALAPQAA